MDTSSQGAVIKSKYQIIDNTEIVDAELFGGHEYKGSIKMDGKGFYKWSDGTYYNGDFQNGEMTGFGTYNFENGVYDGHVYCGIRHGYGTLILNDLNTKYVG
eukprot:413653_1